MLFNRTNALAATRHSPVRYEEILNDGKTTDFIASFENRRMGIGYGSHQVTILSLRDIEAHAIAELAYDHLASHGKFDLASINVLLPLRDASKGVPATEAASYKDYNLSAKWTTTRETLFLSSSYDAFKKKLSRNARVNFVNCRKRASDRNLQFEFLNSAPNLTRAEWETLRKNNIPYPEHSWRWAPFLNFRPKHHKIFSGTLRDGNVVVGVIGGVLNEDAANVFYQLNDGAYRALGPSLVLRSFLIETLINQNIKVLTFTGGAKGALASVSLPLVQGKLLISRDTWITRTKLKVHQLRELWHTWQEAYAAKLARTR